MPTPTPKPRKNVTVKPAQPQMRNASFWRSEINNALNSYKQAQVNDPVAKQDILMMAKMAKRYANANINVSIPSFAGRVQPIRTNNQRIVRRTSR